MLIDLFGIKKEGCYKLQLNCVHGKIPKLKAEYKILSDFGTTEDGIKLSQMKTEIKKYKLVLDE